MITRYSLSLRLEFDTAAARDAAYAKAKTWVANEKAAGTPIVFAQSVREESVRNDPATAKPCSPVR